ncbi:MAG: hypothetical protein JW840_09265 [Candidatus Thermoplasmatota archaeon]|nr:hypothetical protein [Candidatus Thermoplasmatota archaeon]
MKTRRLKTYCVLLCITGILLSTNALVIAQPDVGYHPKGLFFNLQFSLTVLWNTSQLIPPLLPGETRQVNMNFTYAVNRGLLGKMLIRLLEGTPFVISLFIEQKPEWCEAWFIPATIPGVVPAYGEIGIQNSSLFIRLNENAPGNYTIGVVRMRGTIEDVKGPCKLITLIKGFVQDFSLFFQTGPE